MSAYTDIAIYGFSTGGGGGAGGGGCLEAAMTLLGALLAVALIIGAVIGTWAALVGLGWI